ncbi:hypothetical protein [Microbacterium aureliae]
MTANGVNPAGARAAGLTASVITGPGDRKPRQLAQRAQRRDDGIRRHPRL